MDKNVFLLLGIRISSLSKSQILERIEKYLVKTQNPKPKIQKIDVNPFMIFTPNPEIVMYAQKDPIFREIVNSAQINIPDGAGIVWAVNKMYGRKIERLTGADLMFDVCKLVAEKGLRIGLIGGKARVALEALECLRKRYPGLSGWAETGGEIGIRNYELRIENDTIEKIVRRVQSEKTDILFVGLGFPKQEYFIENVKYQMSNVKRDTPIVMMAVGGAFDYISGRVPRAPEWMREGGWEWLYRLFRQPWRLRRQLQGAAFFYKISRH